MLSLALVFGIFAIDTVGASAASDSGNPTLRLGENEPPTTPATGSITINDNLRNSHQFSAYRITGFDVTNDTHGRTSFTNFEMDQANSAVYRPVFISALGLTENSTDDDIFHAVSRLNADGMEALAIQLRDVSNRAATTSYFQNGMCPNLPVGYYLVLETGITRPDGTTISKPMLVSVPDMNGCYNVTTDVKNSRGGIENKIRELYSNGNPVLDSDGNPTLADNCTVEIGDTVSYQLLAGIPAYPKDREPITYFVTDTFGSGLNFDPNSVKAQIIDNSDPQTVKQIKLLNTNDYTLNNRYTDYTTNEKGFTLTLNSSDDIRTWGNAGNKLLITYSAKLNSSADPGNTGNPNSANLTYSVKPGSGDTCYTIPNETVITLEGEHQSQSAPSGLIGTRPSVLGNHDGKITGTTNAMEYKLSTDTNYTQANGTEIDSLFAGTYDVRYAGKTGFNASLDTIVTVPEGYRAQNAPTGLTGTVPTLYGHHDGKITGTTNAMEYKLSTDSNYTPVNGTEIDSLSTGTYDVRYAEKIGFNASLDTVVTVAQGKNQSQNAPTGLTATAPTLYGDHDGKITGTTNAMEYKLSSDSNYAPINGAEIDALSAGTYDVRYAAKIGFDASPDTIVTVAQGANRGQYAPVRLAGIAPAVYGGHDGKIAGATNAMEYKLSSNSNYTPANGTEIDGLSVGTYDVRYAAKIGFDASPDAVVTVAQGANQSQNAPAGLTGIVPTEHGGHDGKITGTTNIMEYRLSTDSAYTKVAGTEIDNLSSGTYDVRYAAKTGYNASPDAIVTIASVPAPAAPSAPSLPSSVMNPVSGAKADLSSAALPASVTAVSLAVTPSWPSSATDPQSAAASQVMLSSITPDIIGSPILYNFKLLDQNGSPITFTGSVTVRLPLPSGLRGTPHVFRYEESTGTFTDMSAKVDNGFLVFSTTHFSDYVVAGMGNAITLDTLNYQMPVNGQYQIGLKLTGSKAASVKVTSTNDKIAAATRLKNGNILVNGKGVGTAYIMIDVYDNKNHLLTHASVKVDVKTGIRPRGDSTRQIGVF